MHIVPLKAPGPNLAKIDPRNLIIKTFRFSCCLLLTSFLLPAFSYGQQEPAALSPRRILTMITERGTKAQREAVYVHQDKPYYVAGDTLWYKAYVLQQSALKMSAQSGLLYMGLYNDQGVSVKYFMQPLIAGLTWGSLVLKEEEFPAGKYILRVYTNWMRNEGEEAVFSRSFYIGDSYESLAAAARASNNHSVPVGPGSSAQKTAGQKAQAPALDVQFMPEGGSLVAGITSRIGIKVLGRNGSSVEVTGDIVDESDKIAASFATKYKGMGSFMLNPLLNGRYTARIKTATGFVAYPLPAVKPEGVVLSLSNPVDTGALKIKINASKAGGTYYLLGRSRDIGFYGITIRMRDTVQVLRIPKEAFPTGIARLTLLDQKGRPLNERQVYIDHHDALKIDVRLNKDQYVKRDSVGISLDVKDMEGLPLVASLSLSVTDNGQLKPDSTNGDNILSRLLLSSGLKGEIESPGHYLQGTENAWQDLDVLLLTQGWSKYDWESLIAEKASPEPKYKAEPEFMVSGTVTNAFGKGVAGTEVSLLSSTPLLVKDTVTDDKGRFVFRNFPPVEKPAFKIKAVNKRGKSFNVGIEVDRQEPPMRFRTADVSGNTSLGNGADTLTQADALVRLQADKDEAELLRKQNGVTLKEVTISGKKMVKGSRNLNGPGNADQVLDEKDMLKADKMSLFEVLAKQVKGFSWTADHYTVNGQAVQFIFDGINLEADEPMSVIDIMNILKYYQAEDVSGLEIMYNMTNTMKYNTGLNPGVPVSYITGGPAYIEITTRGGKGPFMSTIPGMYSYRSIPMAWPTQQFYSPKYKKADLTGLKDKRSTLFWEPNVLTGSDGKVNLSFYTSDMTGSYTIRLEGSDMNGSIGTFTKIIYVK